MLLLLGVLAAWSAWAQVGVHSKSASGGTDVHVAFAAPGPPPILSPERQILLQSLSVTGDNADAELTIYTGSQRTTLAVDLVSTNDTVQLVNTNGLAPGDMLVLQLGDRSTSVHYLDSFADTNSVVLSAPVGVDASAGSAVYRMGTTFVYAVGAATVQKQGDALLAAPARMPMVVRVTSTAGSDELIDFAAVRYAPQE